MNLLRRFATVAVVALAFVSAGWTNAARSELVTYTLTGGTISGRLNGSPFSCNFIITADADSSTFVSGTLSGSPIQSQGAVSTMTLIGFAAPFQITTANFGPFVWHDTGYINGQQVSSGGFGQFEHGITDFAAVGPSSVNIISGGGAISGILGFAAGVVYTTSAGNLEIISGSNPGSATFSSAAAVPEPATYAMALAGIACGGFSMWRRRKRVGETRSPVLAASLALAAAGLCTTPAYAVTIDWVTVGDPGNTANTNGRGAVTDEYRIGKYEVTIGQYTAFLNAAAKSDPYELWASGMESTLNVAGISRSGSSGAYEYTVIGPSGSVQIPQATAAQRPISLVNWFDAARFANWMHNGQGSGSTETGAYTLNGAMSGTAPAKNAAAQFYIPTLDEWYKAAFYKGGSTNAGYWQYATQSDTAPGNQPGVGSNNANHRLSVNAPLFPFSVTQSGISVLDQNYLTDIGAFSSSQSAYGTFDQNGNVNEWNDLAGTASVFRGTIGGDWNNFFSTMQASHLGFTSDTHVQSSLTGFRLAAPVICALHSRMAGRQGKCRRPERPAARTRMSRGNAPRDRACRQK